MSETTLRDRLIKWALDRSLDHTVGLEVTGQDLTTQRQIASLAEPTKLSPLKSDESPKPETGAQPKPEEPSQTAQRPFFSPKNLTVGVEAVSWL